MNNWCICWFSRTFLLGILIFKGLTARCLYKSFDFKGLNLTMNLVPPSFLGHPMYVSSSVWPILWCLSCLYLLSPYVIATFVDIVFVLYCTVFIFILTKMYNDAKHNFVRETLHEVEFFFGN
jgi:hypothetical protein